MLKCLINLNKIKPCHDFFIFLENNLTLLFNSEETFKIEQILPFSPFIMHIANFNWLLAYNPTLLSHYAIAVINAHVFFCQITEAHVILLQIGLQFLDSLIAISE